jgi:glycosyltransferase involved in cell wall biosynthesis
MPTLLQITSEANIGSVGTIAEAIGAAAITSGWKSYIAYGRRARASASVLHRIGTDADIAGHVIRTRLLDQHGRGSRRATRKLLSWINEVRPDAIHLHHLHGYFVNIELLFDFLSTARIPVTWTFHDCWSFTGHCAFFDSIGCEKWHSGCHRCPLTREYPTSFILDQSKENYALKKRIFRSVPGMRIISPSTWLQQTIKDSFLSSVPTTVINNGVDTDVFHPLPDTRAVRERIGVKGKFMVLGVASPWSKRKGLSDFIELSKMLDHDEVIVLVGTAPRDRHACPPNIVCLPRTESREALAELFSAADVFVNPTAEDNFPTTNLEALACGTPVVTYDTGGSPEAVDPQTGCVVTRGNRHELLARIRTIRVAGKARFSDACRLRAIERFDATTQAARMFEVISTHMMTSSPAYTPTSPARTLPL